MSVYNGPVAYPYTTPPPPGTSLHSPRGVSLLRVTVQDVHPLESVPLTVTRNPYSSSLGFLFRPTGSVSRGVHVSPYKFLLYPPSPGPGRSQMDPSHLSYVSGVYGTSCTVLDRGVLTLKRSLVRRPRPDTGRWVYRVLSRYRLPRDTSSPTLEGDGSPRVPSRPGGTVWRGRDVSKGRTGSGRRRRTRDRCRAFGSFSGTCGSGTTGPRCGHSTTGGRTCRGRGTCPRTGRTE